MSKGDGNKRGELWAWSDPLNQSMEWVRALERAGHGGLGGQELGLDAKISRTLLHRWKVLLGKVTRYAFGSFISIIQMGRARVANIISCVCVCVSDRDVSWLMYEVLKLPWDTQLIYFSPNKRRKQEAFVIGLGGMMCGRATVWLSLWWVWDVQRETPLNLKTNK